VIEYRENVFCPRMKEFNDHSEIPIQPSTQHCHLIAHDGSTFNANDSPSFSWKKAGLEWLKAKSKGKGMSEFLCGCVMGGKRSRLHIKYGTGGSDDCWWNAENMVVQAEKAINKAFPGDTAVFGQSNEPSAGRKADPCPLLLNFSRQIIIIIQA